MKVRISEKEIKEIFDKICEIRFGRRLNYEPIENELGKLKKGGALTYRHLEIIGNNNYWPFNDYWAWPSREQIEDKLKDTENLFKDIDEEFDEEEKRIPNEDEIFKKLFKIFKHIELVSIILRFVCPEHYGIYSPPVCKILNPPRGKDYTEEYLNYIKKLREWRDIYELRKAAYTDMFLWALEEHSRFPDEKKDPTLTKMYVEIFSRSREGNPSITNILNFSDFEKACAYLESGDYDTAAKWAGISFESTIREIYQRHNYKIKIENENKRYIPLGTLILKISEVLIDSEEEKKEIFETKELRNEAMHPSGKKFTKEEVEKMINTIEMLKDKYYFKESI